MDRRQRSPACARNRDPIARVLEASLPSSGLVLELGSGTGEHAVYFSARFPQLRWQPSDVDPDALASVASWREHQGSPNLLPPLEIDLLKATWPIPSADAAFCANVIHISPWPCTLGLLDGVARVLPPGAPLVTYGPYKVDGKHTAPSNARFEAWLKARDARFGVRDMEVLAAEAAGRGLHLEHTVSMPANNFCLVFRRG